MKKFLAITLLLSAVAKAEFSDLSNWVWPVAFPAAITAANHYLDNKDEAKAKSNPLNHLLHIAEGSADVALLNRFITNKVFDKQVDNSLLPVLMDNGVHTAGSFIIHKLEKHAPSSIHGLLKNPVYRSLVLIGLVKLANQYFNKPSVLPIPKD